MGLGALLSEKAALKGPETFLLFEDEQISYLELNQAANRVANWLSQEYQVQKGDKVCLMLSNCPEFIYLWFGLAKLGAVMVPINIYLRGEGLDYIVTHSEAKLFIYDQGFAEHVMNLKPCKDNLIKQFFFTREAFNEKAKIFSPEFSSGARVGTDDLMAILYTSGTTGLPKGVMLTHVSYLNFGEIAAKEILQITPQDVFYTCLPLFHINAQQLTTMACLTAGIPMVLDSKFSVSEFWNRIRKYQATLTVFIGTMAAMLFKQPIKEDIANPLRLAVCAAMPKNIWEDFEKRFNLKLVECYGLTETSTVSLHNRIDAVRVGSVGKPVSFAEVQVWNENDQQVPPGELGEIVVKGKRPGVLMRGYYKMSDKTEEAMRGGWFHTGDRGFQDEEGYFFFVDRLKDAIRRRGENISSFEIEKIINDHPKVLESAAVGVPSEFGEEDVKVVIVLKAGEQWGPDEVVEYCKERMAYFMVPRYVEFRESLPKTSTQRIQKFTLKEIKNGKVWDREQSKAKYEIRQMPLRFSDRIALVTGAGRGIGRQIALQLAFEGAAVVVVDLHEAQVEATVKQIKEKGGQALGVTTNVADKESVNQLYTEIQKEFGRLDILINNAGVVKDKFIMNLDDEAWDLVLDVNLKGAFYCIKHAFPLMTARRSGKIVNVASISGQIGNIGQANYCSAKSGVIGLTKAVAREGASYGINVNGVSPGYIKTEMTSGLPDKLKAQVINQIPLQRAGEPQDIANACLFLASDEASYITGHILNVNGGWYM